ncbi:MAG: radical SAM protein [Planctomycetota bacterium]|jgi:putative pyruvate formate lyase activating enzyme
MTEGVATAASKLTRHRGECRLCPRDCGVDRVHGAAGFCNADYEGRFFAEFVHFHEEKRLIPSYVISFSGCNMRCVFCANREGVEFPEGGRRVDARFFRERILSAADRGAATVNLMGGEPTCSLFAAARIFDGFACPLPVIWNSNFYFSRDVVDVVTGLADIFLADLKFGNQHCATRLASAPGYLATVRANLLAVAPGRDLILRHLVMPGHFECCTAPVLDWTRGNLPGVEVSLPETYFPPAGGTAAELGRPLRADEMRRAREYALERGLNLVT